MYVYRPQGAEASEQAFRQRRQHIAPKRKISVGRRQETVSLTLASIAGPSRVRQCVRVCVRVGACFPRETVRKSSTIRSETESSSYILIKVDPKKKHISIHTHMHVCMYHTQVCMRSERESKPHTRHRRCSRVCECALHLSLAHMTP